MKNIITAITLLIASYAHAVIGQWNIYRAYSDITDIEPAGSMVYVLSSKSLFAYNVNDRSVSIYNKVYPLNDTDISYIAWCNSAKRLFIIYDNQNIDLLDNNGDVLNISDYYNKSMTENKTVNNITINGNYAYLSTAFGILEVNVKDGEISNTYNLGMNITDCAVTADNIYAKTSSGIYSGNRKDNLLDKNNWSKTSAPVSFNDANDITVSNANGYKEYIAYDNTNKCYWSNQNDNKLQGYRLDDDKTKTVIAQDINPDGPEYNSFGYIRFTDGLLYTVNGNSTEEACVQIKDNDKWIVYDNDFAKSLDHRYIGHYSIDVNPKDKNNVIVGGQTGIYEFQNGTILNSFNVDNSPLKSASTIPHIDKNYVMMTSVKFDNNGNLWSLNSISPSTSLFEYTKDKEWVSHHKKELMIYDDRSFEDMKSMIFDSRNLLWFTNNYRKAAVICYDPWMDNIKVFDTFKNQDGTNIATKAIRCICEDKNGDMWVGSDVGLLLLELNQFNSSDPYFTQVKVPRNDGTNYADYLLNGIDITSIVIDGGGRKWIGTNDNGVYLISKDNMVQIENFIPSNSKILSKNIQSISIDDKTGEVFFGTDKGLCSYMSDASMPNENMNKDNVYAYPNPVRPDYNGLITITGLSYNADVKIVTVNGTLVAQGRSNGGIYMWDGNDLNGKRAASGIYMVETATEDGSKGTVCKIAIIN